MLLPQAKGPQHLPGILTEEGTGRGCAGPAEGIVAEMMENARNGAFQVEVAGNVMGEGVQG